MLRPGVRQAYLVRRRLRLQNPHPLESTLLDDLVGFNRIVQQGGRLLLEYDASRVHIDQLLDRLTAVGVSPQRDGFNRFQLGWYRYLDANIAANAKDRSTTACSQSPLRHR